MMNNILLDKNKEDKMINIILLIKDKVYDGNLILVNVFLLVKIFEDIDLIFVDIRFLSIFMKCEVINIL